MGLTASQSGEAPKDHTVLFLLMDLSPTLSAVRIVAMPLAQLPCDLLSSAPPLLTSPVWVRSPEPLHFSPVLDGLHQFTFLSAKI